MTEVQVKDAYSDDRWRAYNDGYAQALRNIDGNTSDGFHTFDELYEHRIALFIALMKSHPGISWWSRKHEDGSMFQGGWIIAGMSLPTGEISYHMRDTYIKNLKGIPELGLGKKWDGHEPKDVVERLLKIETGTQIEGGQHANLN